MEEIDLESLKSQGLTDDDLQEFLPNSETPPVEVPVEVIEEEKPVEEETPQDSVTVDEEIPHADNLKAALKEERDRRKVLSAELAALKAQQAQPITQQSAPVAQQPSLNTPTATSIEEQIAKMADDKVRNALGITEDIDTLQYSDPQLYLKYVKGVAKEEFKLESQYEQQSALYNQNRTFVSELQQQADFPVLYQFALAELDEMPGKQSKVIGSAFDRIDKGIGSKDDHETIKAFTAECRAKMAGTTTTTVIAPTTSPLDKAIGLPRATGLSGARTASMSWTDVEKLATQGRFDEIPKDMLMQIHPDLAK